MDLNNSMEDDFANDFALLKQDHLAQSSLGRIQEHPQLLKNEMMPQVKIEEEKKEEVEDDLDETKSLQGDEGEQEDDLNETKSLKDNQEVENENEDDLNETKSLNDDKEG